MIEFEVAVPITVRRRSRKAEANACYTRIFQQPVAQVVYTRTIKKSAVRRKRNIDDRGFFKTERRISEKIHLAYHYEHTDDKDVRNGKLHYDQRSSQRDTTDHFRCYLAF